MGDRIAIMRDGALVQYDTPEAILSAPADAFVEAFVGADRALKRLALIPVAAAAERVAIASCGCTVDRRRGEPARRARADARRRRRRARGRRRDGRASGAITLAAHPRPHPHGALSREPRQVYNPRFVETIGRRAMLKLTAIAAAWPPRSLSGRRPRAGHQGRDRHVRLDRLRAAHARQGGRHLQEERPRRRRSRRSRRRTATSRSPRATCSARRRRSRPGSSGTPTACATTQIFQIDKSYGADGMAVRNNVAKIADLKGKTVAASAPGHRAVLHARVVPEEERPVGQGRDRRQPRARRRPRRRSSPARTTRR